MSSSYESDRVNLFLSVAVLLEVLVLFEGGTARAGFCVRLEVGWLLMWIVYGVGSSFAGVLS